MRPNKSTNYERQSNYVEVAVMARGVSTKLKASLPATYRAGWIDRLDMRTRVARAIVQRIGALTADAGGADMLSHARISLIRRAAFLECICEGHELKLASGEEIDVGAYTQTLNSMLGPLPSARD